MDNTSAPSPGRRVDPVQARGRETLRRLEAAALEVIERDGRDRFTTNAIAVQAGVSTGTLYRYFEDRYAVLMSVQPVPPNVLEAIALIDDLSASVAGDSLEAHEASRSLEDIRSVLLAGWPLPSSESAPTDVR